jgi:hypothetical protein
MHKSQSMRGTLAMMYCVLCLYHFWPLVGTPTTDLQILAVGIAMALIALASPGN